MAEIKIFAINDCEWWAGADAESVKAAFLAADYGDEGAIDGPREVTDADVQRLKYVDDLSNEQSFEVSFQEHLDLMVARGVEFPCFFASTEY